MSKIHDRTKRERPLTLDGTLCSLMSIIMAMDTDGGKNVEREMQVISETWLYTLSRNWLCKSEGSDGKIF